MFPSLSTTLGVPYRRPHVATYASPASFDAPYGDSGSGAKSSGVGRGARLPYRAPPVDEKMTGAPRVRAASHTFSVPRTFEVQSQMGSSTETVLFFSSRRRHTRSTPPPRALSNAPPSA